MHSVLISGAGIAGSTLAYWLTHHGFSVTLVERAGALRSSGAPVDVRGPALAVVERMGIAGALRAAATHATSLVFVDALGREQARMGVSETAGDIEIPRGDLAAILASASLDRVELAMGDQITALSQDGSGVDVTFERAPARRFDYVIGADGLHSGVRRLAFGPEGSFCRHMGIYFATLAVTAPVANAREVVMYNAPGRSLTIHPSTGRALAAFIFHAPQFDARDATAQKERLAEVYRGDGWRVPEMLEAVRTATDLYFDSVSRVRMPRWSKGRIAVLGDAASCVSLFGGGSTLAIAGAFSLATAMAEDPASAFARYERAHRRLVEPKQRHMKAMSRLLIPKTRTGIAARNFALRLCA